MREARSWGARVERARVRKGPMASLPGEDFGAFVFVNDFEKNAPLTVIVSSGSEEIPWEHVSVSTRTRCPTWPEMAWVKRLFFTDAETVIEFHVPAAEHVNAQEFCLHMWRPWASVGTIPRPPSIAVAPVGSRVYP